MEIWKTIKDYPNYEISNYGKVKSKRKILKPFKHSDGYLMIDLISKTKLIHRLVAESFIENKLNKPQVNHIDGDKTNNHVTNLEWCTAKENQMHAWGNGLKEKVREAVSKRSSKEVLDLETGIFYKSLTEASKSINVNYKALASQINKGYKNQRFKYI